MAVGLGWVAGGVRGGARPPSTPPSLPSLSSLESLLNFQTMVTDLTGMQISNASLLDEATAAAEAMTMCSAAARGKKPVFLVSESCHPQTIEVCRTRADGLGLQVLVVPESEMAATAASRKDVCGVLLQYPATDGSVAQYKGLVDAVHAAKAREGKGDRERGAERGRSRLPPSATAHHCHHLPPSHHSVSRSARPRCVSPPTCWP